jgi:hypothetical protein
MIYFEHVLRQARVPPPRLIEVLATSAEPWVFPDLRAEMLDLFPQAVVRERRAEEGPAPEADLVIVPMVEAGEFPLQDVAYRSLPFLRALGRGPLARSSAHVLLYRARWREAEVVAAAGLRRHVSRLARERRLLGWIARSALLAKILKPPR